MSKKGFLFHSARRVCEKIRVSDRQGLLIGREELVTLYIYTLRACTIHSIDVSSLPSVQEIQNKNYFFEEEDDEDSTEVEEDFYIVKRLKVL